MGSSVTSFIDDVIALLESRVKLGWYTDREESDGDSQRNRDRVLAY